MWKWNRLLPSSLAALSLCCWSPCRSATQCETSVLFGCRALCPVPILWAAHGLGAAAECPVLPHPLPGLLLQQPWYLPLPRHPYLSSRGVMMMMIIILAISWFVSDLIWLLTDWFWNSCNFSHDEFWATHGIVMSLISWNLKSIGVSCVLNESHCKSHWYLVLNY